MLQPELCHLACSEGLTGAPSLMHQQGPHSYSQEVNTEGQNGETVLKYDYNTAYLDYTYLLQIHFLGEGVHHLDYMVQKL